MSNGNKHRRKKQKGPLKRRVPVPKKAPKVEPLRTAYRRTKFNIGDIEELRKEAEGN